MNFDLRKQYKKGKTANYFFSTSVIHSPTNYNHIFNQLGTPRNERSIICKRPSQLYQNQTQLITPKVNLRCIKSSEKPLYSSSSIQNNNSNKEIFCFEDDVQQLNIASEENDFKYPLEKIPLDTSKLIYSEINDKNRVLSSSVKLTPTQIKKIKIENYSTEERDNNSFNASENKSFNQTLHQHSFSVINKSPKNIENNNNNNIKVVTGLKPPDDCQINTINQFWMISINSIYKSQDDKQRAKSFVPKQQNYLNLEKIKKSKTKEYNSNGSITKKPHHNKQIKSFVKKMSEFETHHQKETMSSRMKVSSSSKPKDINCYLTSIKKPSNYPVISEMNKKLFHEYHDVTHKHDHFYSNNLHQQHIKSIEPSKGKEYINLLKQHNDKKVIRMIDKFAVESRSSTKKDKTNSNSKNESDNSKLKIEKDIATIKKLNLANLTKNSTSVADKRHYTNSREMKISYIKTDSASLELCDGSSKSSYREKKQPNYSVLSINIISNWGNKTKVGVTEIQLLDYKGKRIPVNECHVFNGNEDNIGRIINNKTHTINDNDMWTSLFAPNIKIEVYFDSASYDVSSVNIWNYNGKDLTKGIKEIELSRKSNICWKGNIPKGCFNLKNDYSCKIKLNTPNSSMIKKQNENNMRFYLSLSKAPYTSIINTNNTPNSNTAQKIKASNIDITNHSATSARNQMKNCNKIDIQKEEEKKLLSSSINGAMPFGDYGYHKYITFSKIKISFINNYGNSKFIGLTGIKFVNKDGNSFSEETACTVGALPKDVQTEYDNDDPQIFENVFNNINETIDENFMWLTVLKETYIEICYNTPQTLSQLIIWNYNEPCSLDKCAKFIEITFDDNSSTSNEILLMKGTGGFGDYSQSIYFPFVKQTYDQLNHPFNNSLLFHENNYVYPHPPSGFWFKFVLLSNYGDPDFIGLNAIEFFDTDGRLIIPFKINNDPEMKLSKGNCTDINNYWLINYFNLNKVDNAVCENVFTVVFEKVVSVSYIRLFNFVRNPKQGVKSFQIFCDDILIFEGEMNETLIRREEIKNESNVVFLNDEVINQDIKIENVIGSESNKQMMSTRYIVREIENGYALTLKGYE